MARQSCLAGPDWTLPGPSADNATPAGVAQPAACPGNKGAAPWADQAERLAKDLQTRSHPSGGRTGSRSTMRYAMQDTSGRKSDESGSDPRPAAVTFATTE